MPDDTARPAERRTGLRGIRHREQLLIHGQWWQAPESGVGAWSLVPVEYTPYIEYRGRVLWHHLSDAHDVATAAARNRQRWHMVKPVRVPGHDHLLWWVTTPLPRKHHREEV